jgi:hypothetical protein
MSGTYYRSDPSLVLYVLGVGSLYSTYSGIIALATLSQNQARFQGAGHLEEKFPSNARNDTLFPRITEKFQLQVTCSLLVHSVFKSVYIMVPQAAGTELVTLST